MAALDIGAYQVSALDIGAYQATDLPVDLGVVDLVLSSVDFDYSVISGGTDTPLVLLISPLKLY